MKKTISLLAAVLFLATFCAPSLMADGNPNPSCPQGVCKPKPLTVKQ